MRTVIIVLFVKLQQNWRKSYPIGDDVAANAAGVTCEQVCCRVKLENSRQLSSQHHLKSRCQLSRR